MAAAALSALLPVAIQEAPALINLIAGLVHKAAPVAEQQYGPSTGPVKFADVFGSVMTDLQKAAAAGQIPKELPSDQAVQVIIQSVLSSMKISGALDGSPSAPAPASAAQTIVLKAGQSLTVTVG